MLKLKELVLCGSILGCMVITSDVMAASTSSSLNSRMNLELDDKSQLKIKNSYLTYYIMRTRNPKNGNIGSWSLIKPADKRVKWDVIKADKWGDGWFPKVEFKAPEFEFADSSVELQRLEYPDGLNWQNSDLLFEGSSIAGLFSDNSNWNDDKAALVSLMLINSLRGAGIVAGTFSEMGKMKDRKTLETLYPKLQGVVKTLHNFNDSVKKIKPYVSFIRATVEYIDAIHTAVNGDDAEMLPLLRELQLIDDQIKFISDSIGDSKVEDDNAKKAAGEELARRFKLDTNKPYDQLIDGASKAFAKEYAKANKDDKTKMLQAATFDYMNAVFKILESDIKSKIKKAEKDNNKEALASAEEELKWLRGGKGILTLIRLVHGNQDYAKAAMKKPEIMIPMMAELGKFAYSFIGTEENIKLLIDSVGKQFKKIGEDAAKKANPYLAAISAGTQIGNVLIPFAWDFVLADHRLTTTIINGKLDPMGTPQTTIYIKRTEAKTGKVTTSMFTGDPVGQNLNIIADSGDALEVSVLLKRPQQFSSERAPWLLNTGFAPQPLYDVFTQFPSGSYVETKLCARKVLGNLDYSLQKHVSTNNADAIKKGWCGVGDTLANDWFSGGKPDWISLTTTDYDDPDTLPAKLQLNPNSTASDAIQVSSRKLSEADQTFRVQTSVYGASSYAEYNFKIQHSQTATITSSNPTPTIGERISFTIAAVWDGVKSVAVKFGDTVVHVAENFGDAIQYAFTKLGDIDVQAFLFGDNEETVGSATTKVNVLPAIALGSITPSEVIRTIPATFVITGTRLPAQMRVEGTGGASCGSPVNPTDATLSVSCSFTQVGEQVVTLLNAQTNQVIGTGTVNVKSNVNSVMWGSNSGTVKFGDTVTYTVRGVNLTTGMGFAVEKCGVSNTEVGTGTDTERTFQCLFNPNDGAFAGQMAGVIKDTPDGQVLFNFGVLVDNTPITTIGLLTATGVNICSNGITTIPVLCTQENLGSLYQLGQDGELQTGLKMSYTALNQNSSECVKDNSTGLIWEQKTDDGELRDKDNSFSWYNSDNSKNGGFVGYEDYANTVAGAICGNNLAKCNTQSYITALNASNYCGYSDWRLPSRMELLSITDRGRNQWMGSPAINPIFINSQYHYHWTSTPRSENVNRAWVVYFGFGTSTDIDKNYALFVRAVRDGNGDTNK